MPAFLIAVTVVGISGAFIYSMMRAADAFMDGDGRTGTIWGGIMAGILVAVLTFLIDHTGKAASEGPCLQWAYSTQFNPATKMTQSYRRCIERGEWVE